MHNDKSTEACRFLHSGKVDNILINNNINDLIFMNADVQPSQSNSDVHSAQFLFTSTSTTEPAGTNPTYFY